MNYRHSTLAPSDFFSKTEKELVFPPSKSSTNLPAGSIILITSQAIWAVDPENLHQELYMNLEPDPGMKIDTAIVSHNTRSIFLVQTDRDKIYPSPADEVTITQIDTKTSVRRKILQGIGLGFHPSPNGSKAAVIHPIDNEIPERVTPLTFCLLEIPTGSCAESGVTIGEIQWINDNTAIALSMDHRKIYQIDATTSEVEILFEDWYISKVAPIPSKNELLVASQSASNHEIEFTVFDLFTSIASILPFGTEDIYCSGLDYLAISPDNQYMMYSCAGPTVLADFQTGEIIARFEQLGFSEWSVDSKSIVALKGFGEFGSLIRIDAPTGKILKSISYSEGGILVTVP